MSLTLIIFEHLVLAIRIVDLEPEVYEIFWDFVFLGDVFTPFDVDFKVFCGDYGNGCNGRGLSLYFVVDANGIVVVVSTGVIFVVEVFVKANKRLVSWEDASIYYDERLLIYHEVPASGGHFVFKSGDAFFLAEVFKVGVG